MLLAIDVKYVALHDTKFVQVVYLLVKALALLISREVFQMIRVLTLHLRVD